MRAKKQGGGLWQTSRSLFSDCLTAHFLLFGPLGGPLYWFLCSCKTSSRKSRKKSKSAPTKSKPPCSLLDEGATVPFIARYRKEVTDGLDDIQLRELEARLSYLRELRDRKEAVRQAH